MSAAPRLIGFCGAAGAGKTTAARYFEHHRLAARIRFAGPLKAMMRALGCTEAEVDGVDKERPSPLLGGRTPRQAMQWLGTEWGRILVDSDLWTRAWALQADEALGLGRMVVADDVRFANEAALIRARKGIVVMLRNPSAGSATGSGHVSETIPFEPDAAIDNDGADLGAFHARLAALAGGGGRT